MFAPAMYDLYQSAVQDNDSAISRLARQPKVRSARREDSLKARASGGCTDASRIHPGFPSKRVLNASTTAPTVHEAAAAGPKLTARGARSGSSTKACANSR